MSQVNLLTQTKRRIARGGIYPPPINQFDYSQYDQYYDDYGGGVPFVSQLQFQIPKQSSEENIWKWISKNASELDSSNKNSKTKIVPTRFQNYIDSIPIHKRTIIYENLINYALKMSNESDPLIIAIKGMMARDQITISLKTDSVLKSRIECEIQMCVDDEFSNDVLLHTGGNKKEVISYDDYLVSPSPNSDQSSIQLLNVTNEEAVLTIGSESKMKFSLKFKKNKAGDLKYSIETNDKKLKKWETGMNAYLKSNKGVYISIRALFSYGKDLFDEIFSQNKNPRKKSKFEVDNEFEEKIKDFYQKAWKNCDVKSELPHCYQASIFIAKQLEKLNKLQMLSGKNLKENSPVVIRPLGENPFVWIIQFTNFDKNSTIGKDLKSHSDIFKTNDESIQLEIRFTVDFPNRPPLIRIIRPRIQYLTGGVDIQGFFVNELLTSNGWSNQSRLSSIFLSLRQSLIDNEAKIDLRHNKPYELSVYNMRNKIEMNSPIKTQNSFKDSFFAFSSQFASTSFDSFDNFKIENGNNLILPPEVKKKLKSFGKKQSVSTIEVKTNKSKCHCGVFQYNAPKNTAIFPTWLMKDLMIEEGSLVDIRSIFLETGKKVVFRPHGSEFWKMNVRILLFNQ
jgi:ubiquitin-protein ligase